MAKGEPKATVYTESFVLSSLQVPKLIKGNKKSFRGPEIEEGFIFLDGFMKTMSAPSADLDR
jgi:hypothetical protein